MTIALVLGGGAPNLTLMAGAVAALDDAGVEFDVVSTSGAGMLIGLLYAAPKGRDIKRDRAAALKNTVNMGVHDAIYRFFPVNFKVFHKPGTLAQAYTKFWQIAADDREAIEGPVGDFRDQWLKMLSASPLFAPWAEAWKQFLGKFSSPDNKSGDAQRFFDDWAALMLATFCPSDLSAASQGMCQPAPFVEQAVDFSKLKEFKGDFYMSAYCIESGEMEIFEKKEITIEQFQAALAFPLIYAPFKMNGKTYLEGAAKDTLNFKGLLEKRKDDEKRKGDPVIDTIVVLDVLGMKELIAEPRSLYDAWVKSIIVPLTAIAKDDIKLFEQHLENTDNLNKYFGGKKPNVVKIDFQKQISHNNWPNVLDWSYGNLSALYEAGYRAGSATAETLKDLKTGAIEQLRSGLRGASLLQGEGGYDAARKIYNAMIDHRPAAIARCAGAADVICSVNFARDNGLLVSVRGGGHNVSGNAVSDGGLMIDLSPMKSIRVDPQNKTVRAEPGVTWGEFDCETQSFGLATTGGLVSTTGIAGLTLGGGLGWLMGKYGLACDNLISADVVTADGRLLTASKSQNEDLFWGLRGGGGNFGVVTSFEFQLHPVGPMLGGILVHRLDKAAEAIKFYDSFTQTSPDELGTFVAFATSPEGERVMVIFVSYNGALEAGERILKPLREFGPPLADMIGPIPYVKVQRMMDDAFPAGRQNYWKSNFLKGLDAEAIRVIVDHVAKAPSPYSAVAIEQFSGAVNRVGIDDTAFNHRNARYNLLIVGIWSDPAAKAANVKWVRDLWGAMQPFSSGGVYVNYLGQEADEGVERVKFAYGPEKYARLIALKQKYDPTNLFRLNQNIRPH